jgi:hypothetical protein
MDPGMKSEGEALSHRVPAESNIEVLCSWIILIVHPVAIFFTAMSRKLLLLGNSQSYFTTGSLPPISLSWRQAPWDPRPEFLFSNRTVAVIVLMQHPLGREMGLSFTIAAGPRQCSSQIRLPPGSWPHVTVSDWRLPQPEGPGPHIYIPQEQSGPVIPPSTGFPFRHLLRLAGLQWRYLTPPPHWMSLGNSLVYICLHSCLWFIS